MSTHIRRNTSIPHIMTPEARAGRGRSAGSSKHGQLRLEYEPLSALKPDAMNARKHSRDQLARLKKSIDAFGFVTPVIVERSGRIVCGHARVMAAKELGLLRVPVIRVEHLSDSELRAFALADNRLNELSSWDEKTLAVQLKELSELNLNFEIEATGFSLPEIDIRIEGLQIVTGSDPADALPDPGPRVSKIGDLWFLGEAHRLACGDARDGRIYARLFGSERADMVVSDLPYNVKISGHVSGKGRSRHREFPMANGEMSELEFSQFLHETLKLLAAHSKAGSLHYLFMDWRHLELLLQAVGSNYDTLMNICVWAKTNGGMGSLYRSQHELIVVARNGRAAHINNVQLGKFGRNRSNIWTYASVNQFGGAGEDKGLATLHPTVKPVAMIADAILDASHRGGLVFDPFMGSGTAIAAAERVHRRCYGIELDPQHVDTAIRRWQRLTGNEARHENGRTFRQLETATARSETRSASAAHRARPGGTAKARSQ